MSSSSGGPGPPSRVPTRKKRASAARKTRAQRYHEKMEYVVHDLLRSKDDWGRGWQFSPAGSALILAKVKECEIDLVGLSYDDISQMKCFTYRIVQDPSTGDDIPKPDDLESIPMTLARKIHALVAFQQKLSLKAKKNVDMTSISRQDFDEFRLTGYNPNAEIIPWKLLHQESERKRQEKWKQGIKTSKADYPEFRDQAYYQSYKINLKRKIQAHGLLHTLDANHVPEDDEVFEAQKAWIIDMFWDRIKQPQARSFLLELKDKTDPAAFWKRFTEYFERSVNSIQQAARYSTYLTTARFDKMNWKGNAETFVTHWHSQTTKYADITGKPYPEEQLVMFLSNAVGGVPDLANAYNNLEAARFTQGLYDPPKYLDYYAHLLKACQVYDGRNNRTSTRRTVSVHEFSDGSTADNGSDLANEYDVDTPIEVLLTQMEVHNTESSSTSTSSQNDRSTSIGGQPRKVMMTRDAWYKLDHKDRKSWDMISESGKDTILKYGKRSPDQSSRGVHSINNHDIIFEDIKEDNDDQGNEKGSVSIGVHERKTIKAAPQETQIVPAVSTKGNSVIGRSEGATGSTNPKIAINSVFAKKKSKSTDSTKGDDKGGKTVWSRPSFGDSEKPSSNRGTYSISMVQQRTAGRRRTHKTNESRTRQQQSHDDDESGWGDHQGRTGRAPAIPQEETSMPVMTSHQTKKGVRFNHRAHAHFDTREERFEERVEDLTNFIIGPDADEYADQESEAEDSSIGDDQEESSEEEEDNVEDYARLPDELHHIMNASKSEREAIFKGEKDLIQSTRTVAHSTKAITEVTEGISNLKTTGLDEFAARESMNMFPKTQVVQDLPLKTQHHQDTDYEEYYPNFRDQIVNLGDRSIVECNMGYTTEMDDPRKSSITIHQSAVDPFGRHGHQPLREHSINELTDEQRDFYMDVHITQNPEASLHFAKNPSKPRTRNQKIDDCLLGLSVLRTELAVLLNCPVSEIEGSLEHHRTFFPPSKELRDFGKILDDITEERVKELDTAEKYIKDQYLGNRRGDDSPGEEPVNSNTDKIQDHEASSHSVSDNESDSDVSSHTDSNKTSSPESASHSTSEYESTSTRISPQGSIPETPRPANAPMTPNSAEQVTNLVQVLSQVQVQDEVPIVEEPQQGMKTVQNQDDEDSCQSMPELIGRSAGQDVDNRPWATVVKGNKGKKTFTTGSTQSEKKPTPGKIHHPSLATSTGQKNRGKGNPMLAEIATHIPDSEKVTDVDPQVTTTTPHGRPNRAVKDTRRNTSTPNPKPHGSGRRGKKNKPRSHTQTTPKTSSQEQAKTESGSKSTPQGKSPGHKETPRGQDFR